VRLHVKPGAGHAKRCRANRARDGQTTNVVANRLLLRGYRDPTSHRQEEATVFERLNTPEEAYNYKLGAALKMEQTVLDMLEKNADEAQDAKVAELFRHHRSETQEHVRNVEEAFRLFGWEVDTSPCPAIEGLEKEGKANAKKTDDALVDAVLLQGAVEVEHHEIGVYESLIITAEAMGRDDVVEVLRRNLEVEQHTLEEVKQAERDRAVAMAGRSG
jgi:ferritin-like metal-binding protein YciE